MFRGPSRYERHLSQIADTACRGESNTSLNLYPGERQRLRKLGFTILEPLEHPNPSIAILCKVDWSNAMRSIHRTPQQIMYINHAISELPATDNLAQQMFLISARNRE